MRWNKKFNGTKELLLEEIPISQCQNYMEN